MISKKEVRNNSILKRSIPPKILLTIYLIFIVLMLLSSFVIYKIENDRVEIKSYITLETGSKVPNLKDYFDKLGLLSDNLMVEYKNQNDRVEDKNKLLTTTIYKDKDGNVAEKSEALSYKHLKKGYTQYEVLVGTYTYDVTIRDKKNDKLYKTMLILKDTTKPILKIKDVEITEGEEVKPESFLQSCYDNSNEECLDIYYVKKDNKRYKKTDDIDLSLGERDVYLQIEDKSHNKSDVVKAKLKVNEKVQEVVQGNSNISSQTYTTNSENHNSNSISCGSQGFYSYQDGKYISIGDMYEYWGCGTDKSFWDSDVRNLQNHVEGDIFYPFGNFHSPSTNMVDECNTHFGNSNCFNTFGTLNIIDKATNDFVGWYFPITMWYSHNDNSWDYDEKVGEGVFLSNNTTKWYWKNF